MFGALMGVMGQETRMLVGEEQRLRVLRGLFRSWLGERPADHVAFDTNRGWCLRMAALDRVVPEAKVICMVRSVVAVMNSFERLTERNPLLYSKIYADAERLNVYTRTEALASPTRVVGAAWCGLKEAYYGPFAERLLLIEYDLLCSDPGRALALLYGFIGEAPFPHDFDDVEYGEPEFDESLATPGLHAVKRRVRPEQRRLFLPPDLVRKFAAQSFWREPGGGGATVATMTPRPTPASGAHQE
jgi:sulfotransferase